MKLRAVILDMDGTITRFNIDYLGARRLVLAELDKLKLKTADMTERSSIYLLLKQLKPQLDLETYGRLRKLFYSRLEEMEIKAAQEVVLYPGVLDTMNKLKGLELRIGLVTNNGRKGTNLTLKRLGLKLFFDAIVTRDDCEEMKPDPGPVRKVLEELKVGADEAIFVGDGVMDIMAAREAGLSSVAVSTGPFEMERLLHSKPDYVLGSVNDLPSLIGSLES
ncbi:MAG: HAD family hydrolase [Candidatus Bathyarchaeia archaeon]